MDDLLTIADSVGLPTSILVLAGSLWMQLRSHMKHACDTINKVEVDLARCVVVLEAVQKDGLPVRVISPPTSGGTGGLPPDSGAFYLASAPVDDMDVSTPLH